MSNVTPFPAREIVDVIISQDPGITPEMHFIKLASALFGVSSIGFKSAAAILSALTGATDPPPLLVSLAKTLQVVGERPELYSSVLVLIDGLVKRMAAFNPAIIIAVRQMGQLMGVDPTLPDTEFVTKMATVAAEKIVVKADETAVTAIVKCPACNYLHVV